MSGTSGNKAIQEGKKTHTFERSPEIFIFSSIVRRERQSTRVTSLVSASVQYSLQFFLNLYNSQQSSFHIECHWHGPDQLQHAGSAPSCMKEAEGHCYLGKTGGLENVAELRGDWRFRDGEGETLRGMLRSPLWSFQSSSSFSIDRRLFTLDSFWRVSCKTTCSVDSCLQR